MSKYVLTPEWQQRAAKAYQEDPGCQRAFRMISGGQAFRFIAEPRYGIDSDIYIVNYLEAGELKEGKFVPEEEGKNADWVLSATYDMWKKVLTKQVHFLTAFMNGDIRLEKGDYSAMLKAAAGGSRVVDIFGRGGVIWPDELSPEELNKYKAKVKEFRQKLKV